MSQKYVVLYLLQGRVWIPFWWTDDLRSLKTTGTQLLNGFREISPGSQPYMILKLLKITVFQDLFNILDCLIQFSSSSRNSLSSTNRQDSLTQISLHKIFKPLTCLSRLRIYFNDLFLQIQRDMDTSNNSKSQKFVKSTKKEAVPSRVCHHKYYESLPKSQITK